jgi:PKHD-type hydroxylase
MLLHIPQLISTKLCHEMNDRLNTANWLNGHITAGHQSIHQKNNSQLAEDDSLSIELRQHIVEALQKNALFFSAALPKRIFPPMFNRYKGSQNSFGPHIDNAIRTSKTTGAWLRTDLSATLFLSAPDDYEGGALVINVHFGLQRIKLPAGDMILYPANSIHHVEEVTSGQRLASFFWVESMIRDHEQRRILFDIDTAIQELQKDSGDNKATLQLTGSYHNLLRLWSEL